MQSFVKLPWAQVWTLNIDDCLERALSAAEPASLARNVFSISWTERHRTPRPDRDEALLVHLHGKASRARDGELIFDISSYLTAATGSHRWHAIFGDTFPYEPVLVVGASLDSEIDLQAVLDKGRLGSPEHPPLIVLDRFSEFQKEEYRRYGLIPVQATASDFFEACLALYPSYLQQITHDESLTDGAIAPDLMRFLSQWTVHNLDDEFRPDVRHDFYAGHEPEWTDVVADLPMYRDLLPELLDALTRDLTAGDSAVECLFGDPFVGKSTLLLSVCRGLLERGFRPVVHVADMAPSAEVATSWLRHYPKTVFLFDRGSDFSRDARSIQEKALELGLPPRILLLDRTARTKDIDRTFGALSHQNRTLSRRMSRREVSGLVERLERHRRLGILRTRPSGARIAHFDSHDREIFPGMAELEGGRGFTDRMREEFNAVQDPRARGLLLATSIAASLGHALPSPVIRQAVGLNASEVQELVGDGVLSDLIAVRRDNFRLRMRAMGSAVLATCVSKEELFKATVALANALGPFVSTMSITTRTQYYRLSRDLMSQQLLGDWFSSSRVVMDWYEQVETAFDWNARFWEQRALAAAAAEAFEPAFSWAMEAVARHEDPYTMNTVGTVLMRRAQHEAAGGSWPADSFEKAVEYLGTARDLERDDPSEYPFETLFSYASRLVGMVSVRDAALDEQLRNVWHNWHARMLLLPAAGQQRLEPTYRRALAAWRAAGL